MRRARGPAAEQEQQEQQQEEQPPELRPRLLFLPGVDEEYDDGAPEPSRATHADTGNWDYPFYPTLGVEPVDEQPLFWYRWIVGHQLSFVLWRAIGDVMRRRGDNRLDEHETDLVTACVDGYSAMLLYAATVPPEHYHSHTRVRMALHHPAFSGTWAPDYRPIRQLFRAKFPWQGDRAFAALNAALHRNRATHEHIADHLVPDGQSLLQKSASVTDAKVSPENQDLYDNFFMTVRRSIAQAELVMQLEQRVAELAVDLRRHGLYPNVAGRHAPVVKKPDRDLEPLTQDILGVMRRAAWLVSETVTMGARS